MGFFYFFPRHGGLDLFQEAGLGYAFRGDPAIELVGPEVGPDGQSGTVFHQHPGAVLPKPLVWRRGGPGLWVGWHQPFPPTPAQLRNGTVTGGTWYAWRLRDGQDWILPLVLPCRDRDPQRPHGLPTIYALEGTGVGEILSPEYEPLTAEARAILEAFTAQRGADLTPERIVAYCARLLGVGQRVGQAELLALGLLGRDEARALLLLSLDAAERWGAAHG